MQHISQFINRVINADCVAALPVLPDGSVDLVLTDPPYLVGYHDRHGRSIAGDVDGQWLKPAFAEVFRVLKPGRFCVSFYGWHKAGAFYVMDRGYVDFERLYVFTLSSAFFVVRTKSNVLIQRRYSHPVDKTTGVRSDHTVILTAINSVKAYPDPLRRVSYLDVKTRKRFKFLTNNFMLPALTIAQIYKSRWQVELFFKWIKQHLRIKAFYGTSENAVKTQIWIAVSVYVLVAIVRKRLAVGASLYQILQILSVTLFEKTPILQALQAFDSQEELPDPGNQLILFDF